MHLDVTLTLPGGGKVELHGTDLTPAGLVELLTVLAAVADGWAHADDEAPTYRTMLTGRD